MASKRPSILATIMRNESGGRNIPQAIVDSNTSKGTPAQGYFQIINPTWSEFGGDKTSFKSAIDAPYATQLQVAQNIPVERWGPNTQAALKTAGYEPKPGETLGQMLARYGEDATATRPEDVGGSSDGSVPVAVAAAPSLPNLPTGLLTASAAPVVDPAIAAAKEAEAADQGMIKTGLGLLAKGQGEVPKFAPIQAGGIHRPQPMAEEGGTPDFAEILARQRLMRRV